jgi:hypothetical protein
MGMNVSGLWPLKPRREGEFFGGQAPENSRQGEALAAL